MVFKSKVDKWFKWFCAGMVIAFIGTIYLCYYSTWILVFDIVMMGICLFMIYDILLHTDYTVDGDKLHIRCGILFRMDLPISKISEISHKSTILSSPALSAKRICLNYGRTNYVYVSPADQEQFISTLNPIKANIKVS